MDFNLNGNNRHIVVDCDEVLVNISPIIVGLMHHKDSGNYDYFNKYFRLSTDPDYSVNDNEERILNRPVFHLDNWLIRKDIISEVGEEEYNEAVDRLVNDLIFHPSLYDELIHTKMSKVLSDLARTDMVDRISVVTKTSELNLSSKERFLKILFQGSMHKVDIYYVEPDEKKSDVISGLKDDIACYIEDEISNIEEVVEKCDNVKDMIILVPSFGYNANISEELIKNCKDKNIDIRTYYYK